jgi:hypothetical protein
MRIVVGEAWWIGIAVARTFSSIISLLCVLCGLDLKAWVLVAMIVGFWHRGDASMWWVGGYEGTWSEYSVGLEFPTGVPCGVGNKSKIEPEERFVDTKLCSDAQSLVSMCSVGLESGIGMKSIGYKRNLLVKYRYEGVGVRTPI